MVALLILLTLVLYALNFFISYWTVRISQHSTFENPHLRLILFILSALFSVLGLMQLTAGFMSNLPPFLSQRSIDLWSSLAFAGNLTAYLVGLFFARRRQV
jgi:hypothetical protein